MSPQRMYLLPRYSQSEWLIGGPFCFVHLYFSDESFKRFAVKTLDIEPQSLELPDLTYLSDTALALMLVNLYNDTFNGADSAAIGHQLYINEIFAHSITSPLYGVQRSVSVRGGLSPRVSRRLTDFIHARFNRVSTLPELASIAGLSEFHLQRMFKRTHAISPQAYLTEVRIEKAIEMMRQGVALSQIAHDCGFSHQSHFNRVFKQQTGATPRQYLVSIR